MLKNIVLLSFALYFGAVALAHAELGKPLEISVDHGTALTLTTPATSVFIANPDIADVQVMSPTSIMIFGKRTGETSFMATDSIGRSLVERTIVVVQDLSSLNKELTYAIPGSHIKVSSVPNGILMTGEAKDPSSVADAYKLAQRYLPAQGGDIINRVHVAGSNQIQIRVRFAEVQRNIDNTFGIDWSSAASFGGFALGLASGASFLSNGAISRPNNGNLGLSNDTISLQHTGGRFNVNNIIDALAQDGLITILAEPTLTAMSGETANFLAGGEFPIIIPQGSGASATNTIEFKSYGISLAFTPTLINENRISLHVKPEVSQLTTVGSVTINNNNIPALTVRRAETTVEVASGESFAIAGLIDNQQSQTVNKYPGLGDIPILGALFRSNEFVNGQTELVVIITPYVVKPSSEQLALPTDGFSPPSESDRLLKQRYSSSNPDARPMSGPPAAIEVEPPTASLTPVSATPASTTPALPELTSEPSSPLASPIAPVTHAPAIANPSPASSAPTNLAPAGPGGFTLE